MRTFPTGGSQTPGRLQGYSKGAMRTFQGGHEDIPRGPWGHSQDHNNSHNCSKSFFSTQQLATSGITSITTVYEMWIHLQPFCNYTASALVMVQWLGCEMYYLRFNSQQNQEMFHFSTTIQTSSGTNPTSSSLFLGVLSPRVKQSWCEGYQPDLQLKPWLQVSVAKPLLPRHEQRHLLNLTNNFYVFSQLTEPSSTIINLQGSVTFFYLRNG